MPTWQDEEKWHALRAGAECWTCARGPRGILIAETATAWMVTFRSVPLRGYVCVYTKRHVVEPHELSDLELLSFFREASEAARAVGDLLGAVKLNYELHGNTNPHLHLHVFPRYRGDAFEGRPIVGNEIHVTQTDVEIGQISHAVHDALTRYRDDGDRPARDR